MEKISFIMHLDSDGKVTVTNTIKYIMENIPEISVPDTDITIIPLAALTLAEDGEKRCIDGYAEGIAWIDGKCTGYKFTLIFG